MNEKEIMAKKNKSKKKWDNMIKSISDLLKKADHTCGYCEIYPVSCNGCPLYKKMCCGEGSVHGKIVKALERAHRGSETLRDAIVKDIKQSKLKGS